MDRWLLWPTFTALAAVTSLCVFGTITGISVMTLLAGSFYLVTAVTSLGAALTFAVLQRPRQAVSFVLALAALILLRPPLNRAADYIHLGITIAAIQLSSNPDKNSFADYDWSVGFAGGPATFLIHDPTDEIALPLPLHKNPADDENGFAEMCAGKATHLLGHYYVCTF